MSSPRWQSPGPQALTADAGWAEQYLQVRRQTEAICAPLTSDDQMVQSTPEASPAKWHQAHTTWFFETFLLTPHLADYRPYDTRFRWLFNSYYKQLGAHPLRGLRGTFSRPTLDEIVTYRGHVDEQMQRWLHSDALEDPALVALLQLGLNHEQQHQELILADIKHAFWSNPLQPGYVNRPLAESRNRSPELRWVEFPGGTCDVGYAGLGFSFDNEGPPHQVLLQPFRLASRLVTNGEYLAFMEDGGYRRPELWLSDGWDTVQANRWDAPLYWEPDGHIWTNFTLSGRRQVRPDEPVCHVSYYEADAFARWADARLPLESEWETAASGVPVAGNLLESGRYQPAPPEIDGAMIQVFGDVWEWTASPYMPYPGYRPAGGALGEYNGKFMCKQMVLRGGSCATPRSHIRSTYRNFFSPPMRWQFMGIRLADGRC